MLRLKPLLLVCLMSLLIERATEAMPTSKQMGRTCAIALAVLGGIAWLKQNSPSPDLDPNRGLGPDKIVQKPSQAVPAKKIDEPAENRSYRTKLWTALQNNLDASPDSSEELADTVLERIRFWRGLNDKIISKEPNEERYNLLLTAIADLVTLELLEPIEQDLEVRSEELEPSLKSTPSSTQTVQLTSEFGAHQWAATEIVEKIARLIPSSERAGVESPLTSTTKEALQGYCDSIRRGHESRHWKERIIELWKVEAAAGSDITMPSWMDFESVTEEGGSRTYQILRILFLHSQIKREGRQFEVDPSTMIFSPDEVTIKDPLTQQPIVLKDEDIKFYTIVEFDDEVPEHK